MQYFEALEKQTCGACETVAFHQLEMAQNGPHYARLICMDCGAPFPGWVGKPESAKNKRRGASKNLAQSYGRGFCEMCLRPALDLPGTQTMEGHHVVEYAQGGTDDKHNVWVVCTACHALIHHLRTYLGHYHQEPTPHD